VTTDTQRIYFPLYDEVAQTYDIYSAKLDGSDRQLVVKAASQPNVNSTGERITYRSWQGDERGLMERGVAGGAPWRYNPHFEAGRPAFAVDDMSFFFQSREAGEHPALYRTLGEKYDVLRRDTSPIEGEAFSLTPDGKSLVYRGCIGADCGLFFTNVDGTAPKQLTKGLRDTNPSVSPDGGTLVYMAPDKNNQWDLYTLSITGTNQAQLTNTPADNEGLPTWSPDGQTIAFVSNRDGAWAIWAMDADGQNQRKLFDLEGTIDGKVTLDVTNSFGWLEEQIDWVP
jgi:TolB protein